MQMDKKQELIKLIQESNISDEDKKEWGILIGASPEEYASGLLQLFTKFPSEIGWFNDIYKKKKQAFSFMESDKTKGNAMLEKIFKEEKIKLDELSKIEN